jgi:hypothetical protein
LAVPPKKQRLSLGAAALALGCPVRHRSRRGSSPICKIKLLSPDYLGKDAVLRTTRKQTPFAVFSLATHRSWKDRSSGRRQSVAEWHRCVVFGKLAAYAGTLTKGTHVQLEGEIRTRQYTPRVLADGASGVQRPVEGAGRCRDQKQLPDAGFRERRLASSQLLSCGSNDGTSSETARMHLCPSNWI